MSQNIDSVEFIEVGGNEEIIPDFVDDGFTISKEKRFVDDLKERISKLSDNGGAYLTPKQRRVLKKALKLKKKNKLGAKKIRI